MDSTVKPCADIHELSEAEVEAIAGGNVLAELGKIAIGWALGKILDGGSYTPPHETRMWKNMAAGKGWWE